MVQIKISNPNLTNKDFSYKMSVVYALVSQEPDLIISDYSEAIGNFQTFATLLLPILRKMDKKHLDVTFPGDYEFHFAKISNFGFMCLSEKNETKSEAFKFLDSLSTNFLKNLKDANPSGQNEMWEFGLGFKKTIKDLMVSHDKWLHAAKPDCDKKAPGYVDEELA